MDILDELKRLTPQTDGDQDALLDLADYQRSNIAETMMQIHTYLRQLISSLNHLPQAVSVDFTIPEIGTMKGLVQENYELSFENRANIDVINLNFSLVIKDQWIFETVDTLDNDILDKLTQAGINFKYSQDARRIEIEGRVPVKLMFSSYPDEQYILLAIHNYSKPGRQRFALTPQILDDYFKNQLGYFILRRENNLVVLLQDFLKSSTDSLPLLNDDITETDLNTTEMDISRIKSLFSKEARIYLTYHNTIKEVSSKCNAFILGRSRQCDMKIISDLASRQHAQIVYRKGKFVLVDKSTNGSFVKSQGGKEVYVQGEEYPLSGSGFISLGKSVTVDNEHVIYYSCQ